AVLRTGPARRPALAAEAAGAAGARGARGAHVRRALGVVATLAVLAWLALRIPAVDVWLFRSVVTRQLGAPVRRIAGDDELSVALCGTGTPLPDPTRAGPCTL